MRNDPWKIGRWILIILGITYLFLHFYPYFSPGILLSSDYRNAATVLSYLGDSTQFQGEGIVGEVYVKEVVTSPLYYYPASVLTHLFKPLNVPRIIGFLMGVVTFLLAGRRWRGWFDGLSAVVITIIFVHLSGSVNPLLGLQRSVTLPALLFIMHPIARQSSSVRLLGILLVTGVYPPAGLILLVFTALEFLMVRSGLFNRTRWVRDALFLLSHLAVFLLGISPYLYDRLTGDASVAVDIIRGSSLNLDTWQAMFQGLVVGKNSALFKVHSSFEMFSVFLVGALLSWLVIRRSRRQFVIPTDVSLVILSGVTLWGSSQLLHPLLYQPSRYTRVSLLLGLILLVTRNLPSVSVQLREWYRRWKGMRVVVPLAIIVGVGFYLYSLAMEPRIFYRWYLIREVFWPGVIAGSVVLLAGLGIRAMQRSRTLLLLVIVSVTLFVFPHFFGDYHGQGYNPSFSPEYRELLEVVKTLPNTSVLAGPPALMNWIPAYSGREVYFNHERETVEEVCQRSKNFSSVYYAPDRETVVEYFNSTPVTHIVVDRSFYRDRPYYQCGGHVYVQVDNPYLDRSFANYHWTDSDKFYVISREDLPTETE